MHGRGYRNRWLRAICSSLRRLGEKTKRDARVGDRDGTAQAGPSGRVSESTGSPETKKKEEERKKTKNHYQIMPKQVELALVPEIVRSYRREMLLRLFG